MRETQRLAVKEIKVEDARNSTTYLRRVDAPMRKQQVIP